MGATFGVFGLDFTGLRLLLAGEVGLT